MSFPLTKRAIKVMNLAHQEAKQAQQNTIGTEHLLLGIIDPGELLAFHLCKHGSLNARPSGTNDTVEYLVLSLNYYVNQVHIYKRQLGKDLEVYDVNYLRSETEGLLLPLDSTATRHTFAGVPLWLRCPRHQG